MANFTQKTSPSGQEHKNLSGFLLSGSLLFSPSILVSFPHEEGRCERLFLTLTMPMQARDEVAAYHARGTGQRVRVACTFPHLFGMLAGSSSCCLDNVRLETVVAYPLQEGFPADGL
jgi:hypothetical protein